jgi:Xaa-Pro dipeptidase
MSLAELFTDHVVWLSLASQRALQATGFETLVISAGAPHTYFADDEQAPFHPTPHFVHWCPARGPHHLLKLLPGREPELIRVVPQDYWYERAPLGDPFWVDRFRITEVPDVEAAWNTLGAVPRGAYIGNETEPAAAAGLAVNPPALTARLDWQRSYKSAYEIACLEEASSLSARGHRAASAAFLAGASEIEIHHAYVEALGVVESELPFGTIVALDEKAATLHYQGKRTVGGGRVLLIDAGAPCRGYAADVTRTHATEACDVRFVALLHGMKKLQGELCAAVRPGFGFVDLHLQAHRAIAQLLVEHAFLRVEPEEAFDLGLSRPFFPHGLGHHLGIQVHDVAGRQADPEGTPAPPPKDHPFLRNTRRMEPGQVLTIEPGLYFIPMLLEPFRAGEHSGRFDWEGIDSLAPLGGIRVEDNVLVTESGHRNLTREHLPE